MKHKSLILIFTFIFTTVGCNNKSIADWYSEHQNLIYDSWYEITEMYHAGEIDNEKLSLALISFNKVMKEEFLEKPPSSVEEKYTIAENKENIYDIISCTDKLIKKNFLDKSEKDALIAEIDYKMFIIENWAYWNELRSKIKYANFYELIIISCILTVSILIFLNNRQLKKKNKEIFDSKENLKFVIKVQENERSRISRELHDSLAQDIRYIGLLSTKISEEDIALNIQQKQSECINKIRNLCYNFAPPDIIAGDLECALKTLIDSFIKETNIECRLTILDGIDFSIFTTEELMHFYRIVQEGLSNIHKHADASEATVLFRYEKSDSGTHLYKLIISDDGCGIDKNILKYINDQTFSIKKDDGSHFGLQSMKERVSLLGGSIRFESVPGDGTQIVISIEK